VGLKDKETLPLADYFLIAVIMIFVWMIIWIMFGWVLYET